MSNEQKPAQPAQPASPLQTAFQNIHAALGETRLLGKEHAVVMQGMQTIGARLEEADRMEAALNALRTRVTELEAAAQSAAEIDPPTDVIEPAMPKPRVVQ